MSKNVMVRILDHQDNHLYEVLQAKTGGFYAEESWEDLDGYHCDDVFSCFTSEEVVDKIVGTDEADYNVEGCRFEFDPCDEPGMPWKLEA